MIIDLRLSVETPDGTNPEHVATKINAALDRPAICPSDWIVGAVVPGQEVRQVALMRELASNYHDGLLGAKTAMDAIAAMLL